MAPTPLFHVTANNCLLQPCTMAGGTIVFTYKWDAGRALELIERERVTNFSGVPTMSREMLMHPDWMIRNTSSMKAMGGGGAPIQPDLVDKIDKSLSGGVPSPATASPRPTASSPPTRRSSTRPNPPSCGRIVPTLEGRLEDELGNVLEPGPETVGELCVRGAVVIKGYLNRDEATADAEMVKLIVEEDPNMNAG